jgi:predicted nucleic acid-binding protein
MSHPRRRGLEDIAYAYKLLLVNFPNLTIPFIDLTVADKAAALRGSFGLKTPDALQLATGIVHKASGFITFDKEIAKAASLIQIIIPNETSPVD